MSLQPKTDWTIPPTTAEIARAAFPKGNVYLKIRDHLGHLYEDEAWLFWVLGEKASKNTIFTDFDG